MKTKYNRMVDMEELRQKAESILRGKGKEGTDSSNDLTQEEIHKTLHELTVHQIELEMQNDELMQAQEKLDISRSRYFDLYELAPIGYLTLNQKGTIVEANLTAGVILGVDRNRMLKQPFTKFIDPEDQFIFYQNKKYFMDDPTANTFELRMLRSKSVSFWVQIKFSLQEDANHQPMHHIVLQDITDKKQSELSLKKLNDHLEKKIQQRTHDLEETCNTLQTFSHSISNDLRSPLQAIVGFVQNLSSHYESKLGEEGRHILQSILENTGKMEELINGLLSLTKIFQIEVNRVPLNMNEIVSRCIQKYISSEDKERTSFTIENLHTSFGDPVMIEQVLSNLIENAVKFTKNVEKPTILIRSYQDNSKTVYLIKDNGIGFNPKNKNKLFNLFQKLHSEEEFEGVGIGLALIDRIIQKHGGAVWAEGIEGQGATFYFSLP